jgi:hypothetical protein
LKSNYVPIEYPKWVGGVLVRNADEEQAHRALTEAVEVALAAEPTRPPSPAAIRMQRTRERRRKGKMSLRFDISAAQIEALATAGFIDPAMRDDAAEVARAVCRSLARLTRSCHGAML